MQVSSISNLKLNPLFKSTKKILSINNTEEASPVQMELSGSEVGRAMLAGMGINFKGSAEPIDVTDKLNKKVEGKSHLELPNLKVYDYPDTNLRVFIHTMSEEENSSYMPSAAVTIQRLDNSKENLLEEIILQSVIAERLSMKLEEFPSFITSTGMITYSFSNPEKFSERLGEYYEILSRQNISEEEFVKAKNFVKESLSPEFFQHGADFIKAYYSDEGDLYTQEEMLEKLEQITPDAINAYYKDFISNSKIETIISTKESMFDKTKLKDATDHLDCMFAKIPDVDNKKMEDFVPNKDMKVQKVDTYIYSSPFLEINYPTSVQTIKDSLIAEFAVGIINEVNPKEFYFYNGSHDIPSYLKNKDKTFDFSYCTVDVNGNSAQLDEKLRELRGVLNDTVNDEAFTTKLETRKQDRKDFLKSVFSEESSPLSTFVGCLKYSSDVFSLYETIDSITADDIKDFINTYLVNQAPVVIANEP